MRTNKSDVANRKITRQIITSEPGDVRNGLGFSYDQKLLITCPICYTRFHRPPSHVARVGVSYCSRACSAQGAITRVIVNCVSCNKPMELTPSNVGRKTTCSKKCKTLKRASGPNTVSRNFADVQTRAKEIKKRGICVNCGVNHGPWAVRGLYGEMEADGSVIIDDDKAELWCRHCHLKDVAHLGAPARDENKWKKARFGNAD